jgi:hypothetical protein
MSDETATIDPKDVRTQVGLAADAPDADVIVELLKLIAQLTAQIETLTGQAAQSEKELANRVLERYADRIPAGTEPFWAEQVLTNRDRSTLCLVPRSRASAVGVNRRISLEIWQILGSWSGAGERNRTVTTKQCPRIAYFQPNKKV